MKKERTIDVRNPMKQMTSLNALKRKHRAESESSEESDADNVDLVSNAYKSKR